MSKINNYISKILNNKIYQIYNIIISYKNKIKNKIKKLIKNKYYKTKQYNFTLTFMIHLNNSYKS